MPELVVTKEAPVVPVLLLDLHPQEQDVVDLHDFQNPALCVYF
jgi:hypothetical protein